MPAVAKLGCAMLACVVAASCNNHETSPYMIDMDHAQDARTRQNSNTVSEARIYLTGPTRFFDKCNPGDLLTNRPLFATTNRNEIGQLVEALSDHGQKNIPSSSTRGYTYHIFLLNTKRMSAMYFRAFVPASGLTDSGVCVNPKGYTSYLYMSSKLVPWMARVLSGDSAVRADKRLGPQVNQ